MIEESLLKSNYIGKDGFVWWIGQVAPAKVWRNEKSDIDLKDSWAYRCKVRIIGSHTFNRTVLSDDDLPWAHVMANTNTGSAQGGFGSTHNLVGGETVFGFFLDGDDGQQPIIVGCIYRNESVKSIEYNETDDGYKPFKGNAGKLLQTAIQIKPRNIANLTEPQQGEAPSSPSTNPQTDPNPPEKDREKETNNGADQLLTKDYGGVMFDKMTDITIVNENGCDDNPIGKITRILQDFIAFVNGIEKYIDAYVDPIVNVVVDIKYQISRFAGLLVGAVKLIVNNMRTAIIKLVGCLFSEFIGSIVPLPQQKPISEATQRILDIIFCLFEKLLPFLLDFITNLLNNMIGKTINAPLCAAEELTAGILAKLIDKIEELLEPIMSGLDWLLGGLSQITGLLSKATSLANQVISFIGCDNLQCKTPSEWSSRFGPDKQSADNWARTVGKLNVLKGLNDNIDVGLGNLSIFGSDSSPFRDCSGKVRRPRKQKDISPQPSGVRFPYCIPPEVVITGDGFGAQAYPVVANNGSILAIEILDQGRGYSRPPKITIIDKSGYGGGAKASAIINNGRVTQIYVTSTGGSYCKPNYDSIVPLPNYFVTADRYVLFEGETVTFTVMSSNVADGTNLKYRLEGQIEPSDIFGGITEGSLTIVNNTATVNVTTLQDSESEGQEDMIFNLYDAEENNVARTVVIIANEISPILPLPPDNPSFPPPGDGGMGTTTTPSPPVGIGSTIIGTVDEVVPEGPGYGYTDGDTVEVGICTFKLVVSDPGGSIIQVLPSECNEIFDVIPEPIINTQTGVGAILYPVIKFTPQFVKQPTLVVNQVGIVTVVDCV